MYTASEIAVDLIDRLYEIVPQDARVDFEVETTGDYFLSFAIQVDLVNANESVD